MKNKLTKAAAQRLLRKLNSDERVFVADTDTGVWMCDKYGIFDPTIVIGRNFRDGSILESLGCWAVTSKGLVAQETQVPDINSIIAKASTCTQVVYPIRHNGRFMAVQGPKHRDGSTLAPTVLFAPDDNNFEVALTADRLTLVCGQDWCEALADGVVVYVDDMHPSTRPVCIKRNDLVIGYLMPTRLG